MSLCLTRWPISTRPFRSYNAIITFTFFFDHDEAERKATAEILSLCPQNRVIDQSGFYFRYKDVNDYLRAKKRPGEEQSKTRPRHVPSVRPALGKPGLKVGGK